VFENLRKEVDFSTLLCCCQNGASAERSVIAMKYYEQFVINADNAEFF